MDIVNNSNEYTYSEISYIYEYLSGLLELNNVTIVLNIYLAAQYDIKNLQNYVDSEETPHSALLNAFGMSREDFENYFMQTSPEEAAKKILYIFSKEKNIITDLADKVRDISYDGDDDESRALLLSNIILSTNAILNMYDNENFKPVLKELSNKICLLPSEDYILLCSSVYTFKFFANKNFFPAHKHQIQQMNNDEFTRYILDFGDSFFHLLDNEELWNIFFNKLYSIKSSSILDLITAAYPNLYTEEFFINSVEVNKNSRLSLIRENLINRYIYGLEFNDNQNTKYTDSHIKENKKNILKSEGFKIYLDKLKSMSDFEFVNFLINSDYSLFNEYIGEEKNICKNRIENLCDEDLMMVLTQIGIPRQNMYYMSAIKIADERGLIKRDYLQNIYDDYFSTERINTSKKTVNTLSNRAHAIKNLNYIDTRSFHTVTLRNYLLLNYVSPDDYESVDKLKNKYLEKRKILRGDFKLYDIISKLSDLPDLDFLKIFGKYYRAYNKQSYVSKQKNNEVFELKEPENQLDILLEPFIKKRVMDVNEKYINLVYAIYNSNINSQYSDTAELYLSVKQHDIMKAFDDMSRSNNDIKKKAAPEDPDL